jgi:hypothetical protein
MLKIRGRWQGAVRLSGRGCNVESCPKNRNNKERSGSLRLVLSRLPLAICSPLVLCPVKYWAQAKTFAVVSNLGRMQFGFGGFGGNRREASDTKRVEGPVRISSMWESFADFVGHWCAPPMLGSVRQ